MQKGSVHKRLFDSRGAGFRKGIRCGRVGEHRDEVSLRFVAAWISAIHRQGFALFRCHFCRSICQLSANVSNTRQICCLRQRRGLPFNLVPVNTVYAEGNKSSHFNPVLDSFVFTRSLRCFLDLPYIRVLDLAFAFFSAFSQNCTFEVRFFATVLADCPRSLTTSSTKTVFQNRSGYRSTLQNTLCSVLRRRSSPTAVLCSSVRSSRCI